MSTQIGRRAVLSLFGAALASRVTPATAQGQSQSRRLGVIVGLANDAEMQRRTRAFEQGLEKRGWSIGRNVQIDYRFVDNDTQRMRVFAKDLVALKPDCILAHSTAVTAELKHLTQTIPIVFVSVSNPIGSGFVASMARPGGNITGFTIHRPTITSKHLSILKELVPRLARVMALYNPGDAPGAGSFFVPSFDEATAEFDVKSIRAEVYNAADIERAITELAAEPESGMVIMPDNFTTFHRALIISRAAKFRIPAIYPYRYFVEEGGLASLGVDGADLFRGAADYVSRIFRGASPTDLPVQAPTKVELAINLKVARALGLEVPRVLLAGADTVIE